MTLRDSHTIDGVFYPDSDGKPLGESDWHINWLFRLRDMLQYRYRGQRVYATGGVLVYFEKGKPSQVVVPDGFVVKDCDPDQWGTFKTWQHRSPDVAFEFTSVDTRREDQVEKKKIYARLGVKEYVLFDPLAEYLEPRLQGYRLAGGVYVRIAPDPTGRLECQELGIHLQLRDGKLVLTDVQTGEEVLTEAESEKILRLKDAAAIRIAEEGQAQERAAGTAAQAARKSAEADREKEASARKIAEAARDALEAERTCLRKKLR